MQVGLRIKPISGNVYFNIRTGTYNEQVSIKTIYGVSETSTVTFQPDTGASVTMTYESTSSENYVVQFDGADYLTFKNMTFTSTSTSYGRVFDFLDGSNNISLKNDTINSMSDAVIYSASGTDNNNILIINNTISNGSYGLHFFGKSSSILETGNEISNNTIQDFLNIGLYIGKQDSVIINANIIYAKSSGGYSSQWGINAGTCDNSSIISYNKIRVNGSTSNYGIGLQSCDGSSGKENQVINNMISCHNSVTNSYGIYVAYSNYLNLYYN